MTPGSERLLILETTGRGGFVALARGDVLADVRQLDEARRHARDLAPALKSALAAERWTPADIDAVFVSRGPGSYTGLRVGIMAAKTLAYATGCAFLALDTFAAIARQAPTDVRRIDVLADAQQGRVYVQRFERDPVRGIPLAVSPLAIRPASDLEDATVLTGPGLRMHGRSFANDRLLAADRWDPRPESLLELGLERLRAGEKDDPWIAEPLYLRPSSAEENWKGRN